MKSLLPATAAAVTLLLCSSVVAQVVETFETALPNGTLVNFADQGIWTITDPTPEISFLQRPSAYGAPGKAVGLGGFYDAPVGATVRLGTSVNTALAGFNFTADFAIVNRYLNDPSNTFFFTEDDRFGFVFSDSTGELLNVDFAPTDVEDIRQVLVNGFPLPDNGILASDYNTPLWYTLGISFTVNGADLDYVLTLAGGGITYSNTLSGKAEAILTGIGVDFDVLNKVAGSNYIVVDNIAVPEPGTTFTMLLSLGLLGTRRRRSVQPA